jgi:hypothetical protein
VAQIPPILIIHNSSIILASDDVMDEKKIYTLFLLVILYELEICIFVDNVNSYFVEINIIFLNTYFLLEKKMFLILFSLF